MSQLSDRPLGEKRLNRQRAHEWIDEWFNALEAQGTEIVCMLPAQGPAKWMERTWDSENPHTDITINARGRPPIDHDLDAGPYDMDVPVWVMVGSKEKVSDTDLPRTMSREQALLAIKAGKTVWLHDYQARVSYKFCLNELGTKIIMDCQSDHQPLSVSVISIDRFLDECPETGYILTGHPLTGDPLEDPDGQPISTKEG